MASPTEYVSTMRGTDLHTSKQLRGISPSQQQQAKEKKADIKELIPYNSNAIVAETRQWHQGLLILLRRVRREKLEKEVNGSGGTGER